MGSYIVRGNENKVKGGIYLIKDKDDVIWWLYDLYGKFIVKFFVNVVYEIDNGGVSL